MSRKQPVLDKECRSKKENQGYKGADYFYSCNSYANALKSMRNKCYAYPKKFDCMGKTKKRPAQPQYRLLVKRVKKTRTKEKKGSVKTSMGTSPMGTNAIGTSPMRNKSMGTGTSPIGTNAIGTSPMSNKSMGTGTSPIGTNEVGTSPMHNKSMATSPMNTNAIGPNASPMRTKSKKSSKSIGTSPIQFSPQKKISPPQRKTQKYSPVTVENPSSENLKLLQKQIKDISVNPNALKVPLTWMPYEALLAKLSALADKNDEDPVLNYQLTLYDEYQAQIAQAKEARIAPVRAQIDVAWQEMRGFIPSNIKYMSKAEFLQQSGYSAALANRLYETKALWLIRMSKKQIEKQIAAVEFNIRYKFLNLPRKEALDGRELMAIYKALPDYLDVQRTSLKESLLSSILKMRESNTLMKINDAYLNQTGMYSNDDKYMDDESYNALNPVQHYEVNKYDATQVAKKKGNNIPPAKRTTSPVKRTSSVKRTSPMRPDAKAVNNMQTAVKNMPTVNMQTMQKQLLAQGLNMRSLLPRDAKTAALQNLVTPNKSPSPIKVKTKTPSPVKKKPMLAPFNMDVLKQGFAGLKKTAKA